MKILTSLKAGLGRSIKCRKGIAIVWLFSLLMVSLIVIPMKSALKTGLGNSMITEKLTHGLNIEVFADLGANFRSLSSYFSGGLFMALLAGFLLNSFLSGGLFNCVRGESGPYSSGEFFRSSSKNFWSFFVILFIVSLIASVLALLVVVLPVSMAAMSEISSEGIVLKVAIISVAIYFLILTFLFLVADYARSWQVTKEKNEGFRALGFGFRNTFRTFFQSYALMLFILIIQLLFGGLALIVIAGFKPSTEAGILLLFIISQSLFFMKILLKVWRYGSVTRMMEF